MYLMDWIRRNWPDLLIGVALLAVIAGIIATLLSGGSFLPFARNTSPAISTNSSATTPTPSSSLPPASANSNTETSNAVQDATNAVTNAASNAAEAVTQAGTNAAEASAEVAQGVSDAVETVVQPIIPDLPSVDAVTPEVAAESAASEATTAISEGTVEASTVNQAAPAVVSDSPSAPYRVSVGAFGSAENAERRAATFREAGYPVFLGRQGNLTIVLVGPYNSEAEAEQIRNQISSSGLEPNPAVYRYDPSTVVEEVNNAVTNNAVTPPQTTPAAETPSVTQTQTTTSSSGAVAPPTSSAGRYLQVGAYNSIEGSMPQRSRLEAMGYTVVHIDESGLIKLLVGPFDANNLGVAQSQLNSQGIESFVR